MNLVVTDRPAAVRPDRLPPARRGDGPARVLFLCVDVLGWQTTARQLIAATQDRADVQAVFALLRPPLWMLLLNRRIPGVRHHAVHPNVTWRWATTRWLKGPLDASRFDVIHCASQIMAAGAAPLKPRFHYKLSLSCDCTDALFHRELSRLPGGQSDADDRAAFAAADLILPWSTWCVRSLVDDYGVDPGRIALARPSAPVPAEPPPHPSRDGRLLRIAFVGNDFVRKGGPMLLKWHQERWADRAELHVASAEAADHAPAKNVTFHGRLDYPKVLDLLDTADLLVHPTQGDMSALVVAEAQARGVPAVASRIAGIPDLLDDGVSGVLVDPADEAGFIAAVESVLFDERRHADMSAAARRFAQAHLDRETTYRQVIDRIIALAEGGGSNTNQV